MKVKTENSNIKGKAKQAIDTISLLTGFSFKDTYKAIYKSLSKPPTTLRIYNKSMLILDEIEQGQI